MAEDSWYYAVDQDQKGPLTTTQMATLVGSGAVSGETLVWNQALPDWTPLSQTELASAPPPRPSLAMQAAPPQKAFQSNAATAVLTKLSAIETAGGPGADFMASVRTCFAKFVTWHGRASRTEFWYFALFCLLALIVASIIDSILSLRASGAGLFTTLTDLALILPNLAVGARRLHDTNRPAWWLLVTLVPLVGTIALLVFFCQPGTPADNRYGGPTIT